MSNPGVFTFVFYHPDTEDTQTWGFIFSNKIADGLNGKDITEHQWFENAVNELEGDYGVHDWGTAPTNDVIGVGYNTYEVEFHLIAELMEKWRKVFVEQSSESDVSEIVRMHDEDYQGNPMGSDTFDYNLFKSKLTKPVNWG
jgi:hypothetical protein